MSFLNKTTKENRIYLPRDQLEPFVLYLCKVKDWSYDVWFSIDFEKQFYFYDDDIAFNEEARKVYENYKLTLKEQDIKVPI